MTVREKTEVRRSSTSSPSKSVILRMGREFPLRTRLGRDSARYSESPHSPTLVGRCRPFYDEGRRLSG